MSFFSNLTSRFRSNASQTVGMPKSVSSVEAQSNPSSLSKGFGKPSSKKRNNEIERLELEFNREFGEDDATTQSINTISMVKKLYVAKTENTDGLAFNNEPLINTNANPFNSIDITQDIPVAILKLISSELAKRFQILPFDYTNNVLSVYYSDDNKRNEVLDVLMQQYNVKFEHVDGLLLSTHIDNQYSGINSQILKEQKAQHLDSSFNEINGRSGNNETLTLTFEVDAAFERLSVEERRTANSRLNFLGALICDAHHRTASDIDIYLNRKPNRSGYSKTELLVKARIDGDMLELYRSEMAVEDYNALTRTLRTACGLDSANDTSNITGLLRPRIRYGTKESLVDLRVNFMHASDDQGSSISIRMQDKFNFELSLDKLGLFEFQRRMFQEHIICARTGLVAIAAPINKGKNVTLVSTLIEIKNTYPGKKIVALENPIEFILDGIYQIEIATDKQYGDYLKDVLRHNPDVTVFSETRTDIDAKACVEAAIQGQLTLTTIHADNATQVIGRLHDLGINHYKIANALRVVISQRLIRKICDKCEKINDVTAPKIAHLDQFISKINWKQPVQYIKASGKLNGKTCPNCQGTGYRGRFGVFEVLTLSTTLREMINRQASNQEILRYAINEEKFQTMWANGLRRVLMGQTTISELIDKMGYPDPEMEGLDLNSQIDSDDQSYELAN